MIFRRKAWHDAHRDLEHEEHMLSVFIRAVPSDPKASHYLRCCEERIKRLKNIIADENEGDYQ
jgi:hypothetical protein